MPESGGPTTQHGIFYQNSVAALALLDLLELGNIPPRERVVEVRVESPEHVDDIVIQYADRHNEFQNVKSKIQSGTKPWRKLWQDLENQRFSPLFRTDDILTIILESHDTIATALSDICERANTSVNESEWTQRLTQAHRGQLSAIIPHLKNQENLFELLKKTRVTIIPFNQISNEFNRRSLGGCTTPPQSLLSTLRDIIGGNARRRSIMHAPALRERLLSEHNIEIIEPREWGVQAYRDTISRLAKIEIPGTGLSYSANDLFVWPQLKKYEKTRPSDFEDELILREIEETGTIDPRSFPSQQLHRCIIVAGPGFGKSAMLTAMSKRLANSPRIPVCIPLATLASSEVGVTDFLSNNINREFEVKIDWRRLAEQGLLTLFFDGLDEIPSEKRNSLINYIDNFSARYPNVPWLLTVRDPAVLIGLSEAKMFEIAPLGDSEIKRFAEKFEQILPSLSTEVFLKKLKAYPDLQRLSRIPLFLTMLLSISGNLNDLPASRADLIETYLKTLFYPQEHKKITYDKSHNSRLLREIAEALAFERLERQEIGASEREVQDSILRIDPQSVSPDKLFAQLLENGILRKQSSIRLQFPFPIVQEYLAACYLIRHEPESLATRIEDAIKRPWAQAIQFALELSDTPTPIIRKMLSQKDDAFCSGLRLVGRCIANGTQVDSATYDEVRDRLIDFWIHAPTKSRERVGSLLSENFSKPLSDNLRAALHKIWLINDGAGEILSQTNDRGLTLSVLHNLIKQSTHQFIIFHSLRPAISSAGDVAFSEIVSLLNNDLTEIEINKVCSTLWHFFPGSVSRSLALDVAQNMTLPDKIRMKAYHIAGPPLEKEAIKLLDNVLISNDEDLHLEVGELISIHKNSKELLKSYLQDQRLSEESQLNLLDELRYCFPKDEDRGVFLNECLDAPLIETNIKKFLLVFAARYGNKDAFNKLIQQIKTNQFSIVCETISLFGYYPDRKVAELAAELISSRKFNREELCSMASSVVIGMLYIFEMDGFGCGVLKNTSAHPGLEKWTLLLNEWLERDDFSTVQRINLLNSAAKLGSIQANSELLKIVLCIENPDSAEYYKNATDGYDLGRAIDNARRLRPLLPLDLTETFVKAKRSNVSYAGIRAIEAHSNLPALNLLIKLHKSTTGYIDRDSISNAIELLAGKLGLFIDKKDKTYIVV